jgi:hypothetical protein
MFFILYFTFQPQFKIYEIYEKTSEPNVAA